jgi:hypothetical protein
MIASRSAVSDLSAYGVARSTDLLPPVRARLWSRQAGCP